MGRGMNRVNLYAGRNIESGLLKAETQAAYACEQVDSDRSGQCRLVFYVGNNLPGVAVVVDRIRACRS